MATTKNTKGQVVVVAKQLIAGTAKRASTRAARHTMGTKQRLAVVGDVTGVIVTPIEAGMARTVTKDK